ncbi:TrkH family potassium uptake protein [Calditerrivibrio nitroreducens]|uniref:Potassium uptake protein, TrkH family n=1 Tax=Calditerrivibrio nitroreducens (strain DSM 19672 / NBRC 101217 / Yu37-1) TaxID=768670 RepID=E4TIZ4_CALNY|nr:TrkH family potassium uptake protein [Calditerrivibrio nitroreducens]ADR19126.1 potassium uptake protein, TrkH family [Calditerrivibrio nitroreducens DSM 19672]
MRFKFIFKVFGYLVLIVSLFMIFPIIVAYIYKEVFVAKVFFFTMIFNLCVSFILIFLFRKVKKNYLSSADGMFLVSIGWIVISLVSALPYTLSGVVNSFTDAFFESISGYTTTGATIFTAVEHLPKSILFWRSLTHWLGGMGIVVLTVAILPLLGIGGMQLIKAEAPGPSVDKISPRITTTAKYLWFIYIALTLAEVLLLMVGGMNFFDALNHSFATLATGGFSVKNESFLSYKNPYYEWVVAIFMILAGMNFTLHYKLFLGRFEILKKDSEWKFYVALIGLYTFIIGVDLYNSLGLSFHDSIRSAFFQVATIITTTGFASADYEKWSAFSQVLLFALMFVGGCSGSTGGGIKVIRVLTLLKQAINEMKYLVHPRGVFVLKINGESVRKNTVYAISGFFFLYMLTNLFIIIIISISGVDLTTAVTASLACVGNIGPGFGAVGPMDNYSSFSDFTKWTLSFGMLLGRLEIYTFLIIITPYYWKK